MSDTLRKQIIRLAASFPVASEEREVLLATLVEGATLGFAFEEGAIVRSTYRARWIGVVEGRKQRPGAHPVYDVRVVLDHQRNPVPKHIRAKVMSMDEAHLAPYITKDTAEEELIRIWSDPLSKASDLPLWNRFATGDDKPRIIDNAGYKDLTGIRRVPVARLVMPDGSERVAVGNDAIDKAKARISGKPYMSDQMMEQLFSGPLVVEEKVDGHPVVIITGGYTFFCESLRIQHSVEYSNVPFSLWEWPDMTVVYDVLDGEHEPPYRVGGGKGKWLTRSEKETVCDMVGAPLVPLIWRGTISPEELPKLADRISSFGSSRAEGLVLKNYKSGVFGKFINLEFQQRISDEALQGGVHPMQRGVRNIRRFN